MPSGPVHNRNFISSEDAFHLFIFDMNRRLACIATVQPGCQTMLIIGAVVANAANRSPSRERNDRRSSDRAAGGRIRRWHHRHLAGNLSRALRSLSWGSLSGERWFPDAGGIPWRIRYRRRAARRISFVASASLDRRRNSHDIEELLCVRGRRGASDRLLVSAATALRDGR